MDKIFAIGIFAVAYFFIASEKINKTIVALIGASMMMLFHLIPQEKAFEHIDFNVIFLLISMMILMKILEQTGVFEYLSIKLTKLVKGNPYWIMTILFFLTAITSAFLDNVTTVILIAPVALLLAKELEISPMPFLIVLIFSSNIGGTATLIGDPPNIMIGSAANLTFMDFVYHLSPVIAIICVVFAVIFYFIFRGKMVVTNQNRARILEFDESRMIKNHKLLKVSLVIFSGVILAFMFHGLLHLEVATIAIAGSTLLILFGKIDVDHIFKEVEWTSIFFFIGLFIMVGTLVETGVIKIVSTKMLEVTGGDIKVTSVIILWFSGVFSAIVDNIPFVATMIPLVQDMGANLGAEAVKPVWWALSLGACLGGNGTLIGASANIIIANFAEKAGHKITFMGFLKYSVPLMLLSVLISHIYLILRYF